MEIPATRWAFAIAFVDRYHLNLELPPSLLQGTDVSIWAQSTCSSKFCTLVVRDWETAAALDPQLLTETCFSSHPEEIWTERHSGCGGEARQGTDSSSSPGIKPRQVRLKLVRWSLLKCTQRSALLLHAGPFSRHLPRVTPAESFIGSTIPRQGAAIYFGPITEMYLAPVPDKLLQGSWSSSLASLSVVLSSSSLWCPVKKMLRRCQAYPRVSLTFAFGQASREASLQRWGWCSELSKGFVRRDY